MFKCQAALVCALICFARALLALVLVLCMLHLIWVLAIAPVDNDSLSTTPVFTSRKDERRLTRKDERRLTKKLLRLLRRFLHLFMVTPSSPEGDSFISLRRFLHLLKSVPSSPPNGSFISFKRFLHLLKATSSSP